MNLLTSCIYIALDHCDLDWLPQQVLLVENMWNKGASIEEIAIKVNRPIKEVFILLFDRLELGKISERKGGIFGDSK